jgi:hypothetical protein
MEPEFIILLIAFLKRDVALVAIGAILGGVTYASLRVLAWTAEVSCLFFIQRRERK